VASTVAVLSPPYEVEVACGHLVEAVGARRLSAHHDQGPGDIIEAVSALVAGRRAVSVLDEAMPVGQAMHMVEARRRNTQRRQRIRGRRPHGRSTTITSTVGDLDALDATLGRAVRVSLVGWTTPTLIMST
jgi:hypothetical protein